MATKTKHTADKKALVEGCGTILKGKRLEGGYKLVKRKRKATESSSVSKPAKRKGRPAKAKVSAPAVVSAPAKRKGRPAKAKVSAPAKAKVSAPVKAKVSVLKKSRGKRKSVKA
jgi:hypothetical protein